MDKTKMKRTAKVVATGIEVSYDLSELPAAEQAALSDMKEGE